MSRGGLSLRINMFRRTVTKMRTKALAAMLRFVWWWLNILVYKAPFAVLWNEPGIINRIAATLLMLAPAFSAVNFLNLLLQINDAKVVLDKTP